MSQRDETRQTQRMMIFSMITVFTVVAIVIAVFAFMHKSDQQEASAATDSDRYNVTGRTDADREGQAGAHSGQALNDYTGTTSEGKKDSDSQAAGNSIL